MAAPSISMSPELLRERAKNVRSYKAQHDEVMAKMKTLINGLDEVWKGEAQTSYMEKFASMQPTFKNFSEMLEGYAQLMETSANDMEAYDQQLGNRINNSFS